VPGVGLHRQLGMLEENRHAQRLAAARNTDVVLTGSLCYEFLAPTAAGGIYAHAVEGFRKKHS
jgi:hypothetical protein